MHKIRYFWCKLTDCFCAAQQRIVCGDSFEREFYKSQLIEIIVRLRMMFWSTRCQDHQSLLLLENLKYLRKLFKLRKVCLISSSNVSHCTKYSFIITGVIYFSGDDSVDHSIGIAEIDARLEALQRFMKDNMDWIFTLTLLITICTFLIVYIFQNRWFKYTILFLITTFMLYCSCVSSPEAKSKHPGYCRSSAYFSTHGQKHPFYLSNIIRNVTLLKM